MVPYDHNIIKLNNPIRQCDYINASRISFPNNWNKSRSSSAKTTDSRDVSFIVSQGPLPNTCVHHLQMIFEQNIDAVVMLTKLEEPSEMGMIIDNI